MIVPDFQKRKGIKVDTLAITHEDTLFGTDSGRVQRTLAQKYGYRIVADFPYRARFPTPSRLPTSATSTAVAGRRF